MKVNFRRTRLSTQDTKSITEHNKQKGHWNLPVLKSMAEAKCELAVSSANLGERSRKHRFVFRESPKLPVWQMLHLLYVQRTPWLQLQNLQMVTGRSFSLEAMKLLKSDGLRNYNSYNSYNELMWQRLSGSTPGVYLGSSQHLKGRPCRQNASCLKSQLSVGATKGSTRFLLFGVPKDWHWKFMEIPYLWFIAFNISSDAMLSTEKLCPSLI